ncbi:MAG TPA: ATP-grasp domain-containing protein [Pyrinomonadaceae bacterium]|jgi:biotin carboxylase
MKRILVLGAGLYNARVLVRLREAGFHVLAVDRDPEAAGSRVAHEFKAIDLSDAPAVLRWAEERRVDGVMAVNDFGARTASYVAARMGLPGLPPEVAEAANDKGLMRDVWKAAGLPIPSYRVVGSLEGLRAAAAEVGFPCVLKPTDCGGSGRGISVVRSADDLEWAFDFARPYVKNDRFIVEQFLDGTEMTVETISIGGRVTVLAMSDKVKPELRTRVATSLNYPADLPEATLREVESLVRRAVLAIGIADGMAHTEVIVTGRGPALVEVGARGGGGHIFHTIIEAVSGVDAPAAAARLLTGLPVELPPLRNNGAVYRFFNPPAGILKAARNFEEARRVEGVLDIGLSKRPGDRVGNLENSLQRAGFVVTAGRTRREAVEVADRVESLIEFVVEPAA